MRTKLSIGVLAVLSVAVIAIKGVGQVQPPDSGQDAGETSPPFVFAAPPPPATSLERALAAPNLLVVKGYTDIGVVNGDSGSSVRVTAVSFTLPTTNER